MTSSPPNRRTEELLNEISKVDEDRGQLKEEVVILKDSLRALGQSVSQMNEFDFAPRRTATSDPFTPAPATLPLALMQRLFSQLHQMEISLTRLEQSVELKYRQANANSQTPTTSLGSTASSPRHSRTVVTNTELSSLCQSCIASNSSMATAYQTSRQGLPAHQVVEFLLNQQNQLMQVSCTTHREDASSYSWCSMYM